MESKVFCRIADTSHGQLATQESSSYFKAPLGTGKPTLDISQIGVGVVVHIVKKNHFRSLVPEKYEITLTVTMYYSSNFAPKVSLFNA
jgi:hypothetical protein